MVVVNAVVLTICVIFAIFLPQIGTIIRLVYVTVFFTLRVTKICDRTSRLRVRLNRSESDQMASNENPNIRQEYIPVGCVPPTCCPYLRAYTALGGVWSVEGACFGGEWRGWWCIPACNGADPPPVHRILDTRF